jgi:glucosamine-6-phosphate deaminase
MNIQVFPNKAEMSVAAAARAATLLRDAIASKGEARIIAATGAAQFNFLEALTTTAGIDWKKVEMFHLDEYIGLPIDHPASFRKFLLDRLIRPAGIERYHLLDGESNPERVCEDMNRAIAAAPIDVAFVGIGENGHLAFNDPPADFNTQQPYIIVALDEVCRKQQVGEGWFATLADVPTHALSMSCHHILKSCEILAIVPETRKAEAVRACVAGPVSPMAPASILQTHPHTTLYLDVFSASLLTPEQQGA